jgi:hypothetical protein
MENPLPNRPAKARRWIYLLLLVPWVFLMWPASYMRWEPTLYGIPFFFWYQFAWVFITSGLTAIVYWRTR